MSSEADNAMAEAPPQRIGRYEVLAELGRGAMGIVYRARDPQIDRVVAIKTLRRDLGLPPEAYAELKKRFYQEATAAGRLSHPNIVTIHDVVELDEVPYIVMEYLEGRTLADQIATGGPLSPDRVVGIVLQVCGALDFAHTRGVVHRDIKPGNILVTASGVAKVSDFGIARVAGSNVTRTGVVLGTPAYMSPEQLRGRVPDGRSDLFALGVVLYEALTAVNPFQAEDLTATLYQVVQVDPVPVSQRNPRVPAALERVTARVMAKEPEQRYPTAGALADALRAALEPAADATTVALEPAGGIPRPRRARRLRASALIAAGCLVVAAVAGVGGWALWGRQSPGGAGSTGSATPVPPAGSPGWRRVGAGQVGLGSIVVATDPAVEVLLDGAPKGRTGDAPLLLPDVPAGERLVTLRRGSRTHELRGTVREGETLQLAYRFPDERDMPLDKLLEATRDKLLGTAREKLREGAEKLRELGGEKPVEAGRQKRSGGDAGGR